MSDLSNQTNQEPESIWTNSIAHILFTGMSFIGFVGRFTWGAMQNHELDQTSLFAAGVVALFFVSHLAFALFSRHSFGVTQMLAALLMVASIVVCGLPLLMKPDSGWFYNEPTPGLSLKAANTPLSPRIYAPGDKLEASWEFRRVKAISGRWRGRPSITFGGSNIPGGQKTARGKGREDKYSKLFILNGQDLYPKLFAKFSIPRALPYGQKIPMEISLPIEFPKSYGEEYRVRSARASKTVLIIISDPQTKDLHNNLAMAVAGLGVIATLIGGLMFAYHEFNCVRVDQYLEAQAAQSSMPPNPGQRNSSQQQAGHDSLGDPTEDAEPQRDEMLVN